MHLQKCLTFGVHIKPRLFLYLINLGVCLSAARVGHGYSEISVALTYGEAGGVYRFAEVGGAPLRSSAGGYYVDAHSIGKLCRDNPVFKNETFNFGAAGSIEIAKLQSPHNILIRKRGGIYLYPAAKCITCAAIAFEIGVGVVGGETENLPA